MKKTALLIVFFFAGEILLAQNFSGFGQLISNNSSAKHFPLSVNALPAGILVDSADDKTVVLATDLLADDIKRVTGARPSVHHSLKTAGRFCVITGSLRGSRFIQQLVAAGKINVDTIRNAWESCLIQVVDKPFTGIEKALVIAGSDRRGTAYGLLGLSQQMGVSPWYFFADVPVKKRSTIWIAPGKHILPSPSVQYRGIFINDEMWGIRPWSEKNYAPQDSNGIGPATYRRIFELMLRLKANYLWPAMHQNTKPFNHFPDNKKVADSFAIVMGSSHIEPMLRNNMRNAEWDAAFPGEPFDYVKNKEHIYTYWEDRVKENGQYENIYTLGKRGQDDEPGKEVNVSVLGEIINDQRKILQKWVNPDITKVPQILIPYTEVLNLYNEGLKIPDDVTICWPDDNFGNIRQLPDAAEQQRSGGSGIYYHFQWLNGATTAYPWLYTTSLGLTWSELKKAYDYNARKIWIVNVGDIKPYEIGIEFFMQMAWNVSAFPESNPSAFLQKWATRDFGERYAKRIAAVMEKHYNLAYARRPEHMMMFARGVSSWEYFSTVHYNDEAQQRINAYEQLLKETEQLYQEIPFAEKDAFYEMVLYNIRCAALQNKKMIYGQKSHQYGLEGRASAIDYAKLATSADTAIKATIDHYNNHLLTAGSKWNYMASLPGPWGAQWHQWDMPPLSAFSGSGKPMLHIANEGGIKNKLPGFNRYNRDSRFIDLYNSGTGNISWKSSVSDPWIRLNKKSGSFSHEERIEVAINWEQVPKGNSLSGQITITGADSSYTVSIEICNPSYPRPDQVTGFVETNGYVSMEAEHYTRKTAGRNADWTIIKGLGRNGASVTASSVTIPAITNLPDIIQQSPSLEYAIHFFNTDSVPIQFYCTPSKPINKKYKSRIAVAIDDAAPQILSYQNGNIIDNLATITGKLFISKSGAHRLRVWMVDPGVVIDKIVINTGGVKPSYLGPPESYYRNTDKKP
jgi:hypothetical protein